MVIRGALRRSLQTSVTFGKFGIGIGIVIVTLVFICSFSEKKKNLVVVFVLLTVCQSRYIGFSLYLVFIIIILLDCRKWEDTFHSRYFGTWNSTRKLTRIFPMKTGRLTF